MGKDDLTMFVTSPGGIIMSLKCPLQTTVEMTEFYIHCVDITMVLILTFASQDNSFSLFINYSFISFFITDRAFLQRKLFSLCCEGWKFVHLEDIPRRRES